MQSNDQILSLHVAVAAGDFLDYFYVNYYGCDVYGYGGEEEHCTAPMSSSVSASLYFTSLVVIVGNIMMSLFVGVITNKMEEAAVSLRHGHGGMCWCLHGSTGID